MVFKLCVILTCLKTYLKTIANLKKKNLNLCQYGKHKVIFEITMKKMLGRHRYKHKTYFICPTEIQNLNEERCSIQTQTKIVIQNKLSRCVVAARYGIHHQCLADAKRQTEVLLTISRNYFWISTYWIYNVLLKVFRAVWRLINFSITYHFLP